LSEYADSDSDGSISSICENFLDNVDEPPADVIISTVIKHFSKPQTEDSFRSKTTGA
jgi:hypothetical protein